MTPSLFRMAGDERLARLVTAGHDGAFTVLYDRHRDVLVRYCRSLVRDDQDALDAFQSTMLNALRALREDRRRAPVRPWLFRIAHNESISVLRRRPSAEPLDDRQLATVDVHRTAEDREALAGLLEDLGSLTDHQRAALLLRELGGLEYADVASVLETTPLAARQAVFAARASLHDQREGRELPCAMVQRRLSDADRRASRTRVVRAHLRRCADCRGFASAIGHRRRVAVLVPIPPAFASSGLLLSILDTGGGGTAAAGGGAVAAGVVAKAAVALSAAVVATGAAERPRLVHHHAATQEASVADVATASSGGGAAAPSATATTSAARTVARSGTVTYSAVRRAVSTSSAPAQPTPATTEDADLPYVAAHAPARREGVRGWTGRERQATPAAFGHDEDGAVARGPLRGSPLGGTGRLGRRGEGAPARQPATGAEDQDQAPATEPATPATAPAAEAPTTTTTTPATTTTEPTTSAPATTTTTDPATTVTVTVSATTPADTTTAPVP
ncbi:MAG TPA: sigma-70 family RNA polymerase sigma factor [Baekduia sp.]